MRHLRLITLILIASLAGCFVMHPKLIGTAEKVEAGLWAGTWVVEGKDHEEPEQSKFYVTEVDPEQGIFSVDDFNAKFGTNQSHEMEVHVRRVDKQLFLNVRYQFKNPYRSDNSWMLFVVEEVTRNKIVLAWQPAEKPFREAIARGDFTATLNKKILDDGPGVKIVSGIPEITFAEMNEKEAEYLAKNWRKLFTPDRIILNRLVLPR